MCVIMPVIVSMTMRMTVIVVMMAAAASACMIVFMTRMRMSRMIMRIGARFGLKRAGDMRDLASLPAHHFRQNVIVLNIQRIGSDFGRCVPVTDMPCHFQQTQRIVGFDFKQGFSRRFHKHQTTILQFERIAVIEHCCLFQIEQKGRALFPVQDNAPFMPPLMIERHLIDHAIHFNRRLA